MLFSVSDRQERFVPTIRASLPSVSRGSRYGSLSLMISSMRVYSRRVTTEISNLSSIIINLYLLVGRFRVSKVGTLFLQSYRVLTDTDELERIMDEVVRLADGGDGLLSPLFHILSGCQPGYLAELAVERGARRETGRRVEFVHRLAGRLAELFHQVVHPVFG